MRWVIRLALAVSLLGMWGQDAWGAVDVAEHIPPSGGPRSVGAETTGSILDGPIGTRKRLALSLAEAFRMAVDSSERVAQGRERVARARTGIRLFWSQVKPRIFLRGTEKIQDALEGGEEVASAINRGSLPEVRAGIRQPLFNGLREVPAWKGAQAEVRAAEWNSEEIRRILYIEVAESYVSIFQIQHEIRIRQEAASLARDRMAELTARSRIGRARQSEVLAAQAQLAQIVGQIEELRGRERAGQADLRYWMAMESDFDPVSLPETEVVPLEEWMTKIEERADIAASRAAVESAGYNAESVRRERWPTLAADGSYFVLREGVQEGVKWDLLLTLEFPLYTGGNLSARIAEAGIGRRIAELDLGEARRRAEAEIRGSHDELAAARKAVQALEEAARLADANVKAQTEDNRKGLVTNLDVLGSISTLQEARLQLLRARVQEALAGIRLKAAAGMVP